LHGKTLGRRCQDGLVGSYRAFVFLDENIPIDRHFVIFEVGHRYWIRCTAVFTKEDWSTRNAEWERVRPRYPSRRALIINDLSGAQQEIFGIFAIITREDSGVTYTRCGCRVIISQIPESESRVIDMMTMYGRLPVPVGEVQARDSVPSRPLEFIKARLFTDLRQYCVG
jgi:hypothetical protein